MQALTGLALLSQFGLAGVIGVRLLRIPDRPALAPERCLGWFFLLGHLVSGVLITASYAAWSIQGRAESSGFVSVLHALGQLWMAFGYAMILLFTQRTFHPDSRAARRATGVLIGALAVSLLGRALHEGFAITLDPGPFHWTAYACRMVALAWAAWASFGYGIQMGRRRALGLADPLVANRFFLWGVWALGNIVAALSEPTARLVYGWLTGADAAAMASIQQVGGTLLTVTLGITSLLSLATTGVLFLAFFPTDAYRSWIAARAVGGKA